MCSSSQSFLVHFRQVNIRWGVPSLLRSANGNIRARSFIFFHRARQLQAVRIHQEAIILLLENRMSTTLHQDILWIAMMVFPISSVSHRLSQRLPQSKNRGFCFISIFLSDETRSNKSLYM